MIAQDLTDCGFFVRKLSYGITYCTAFYLLNAGCWIVGDKVSKCVRSFFIFDSLAN